MQLVSNETTDGEKGKRPTNFTNGIPHWPPCTLYGRIRGSARTATMQASVHICERKDINHTVIHMLKTVPSTKTI